MACMNCQVNSPQTSASSVAHSHSDTEATFIGHNSEEKLVSLALLHLNVKGFIC